MFPERRNKAGGGSPRFHFHEPGMPEPGEGRLQGQGDVLGAARIAGIMGAKRTSELIPLCHLLNLTKLTVDFEIHEEASRIEAICRAKTTGRTGVEMEALTGVSVALLTIYDMCKAVDKTMEISGVHLEYKSGGKSGVFINPTGRRRMKDRQGREIDYMRISITDRCNLRCRYCMPDGIETVPRAAFSLWKKFRRRLSVLPGWESVS